MRKRIVIGLIAAVVIGVVGIVVTQPKRGSVEWHKREFFRARDGSALGNAFRTIWNSVSTRVIAQEEDAERIETHFAALLKLGYLEERKFVVSNREPNEVADALLFLAFGNVFTNEPIDRIEDPGTNSITIIAPRDAMSKWEKLIRQVDVPETEK